MKLSVITPTCNRPVGMDLAAVMMSRQTRQPDEWIVANGGEFPLESYQGQIHTHEPSLPGALNLAKNLMRGIEKATGDAIVIWEDDDWYAPTHLAKIEQALEADIRSIAAGDDQQRYYHVGRRFYRTFHNVGASLCQTAFRREAMPMFLRAVEICRSKQAYGIDRTFWDQIPLACRALHRMDTVVGIKGLPGQVGLGIGHRDWGGWFSDPKGTQLEAWIGASAQTYWGLLESVSVR